jgi:hypothetical protein
LIVLSSEAAFRDNRPLHQGKTHKQVKDAWCGTPRRREFKSRRFFCVSVRGVDHRQAKRRHAMVRRPLFEAARWRIQNIRESMT